MSILLKYFKISLINLKIQIYLRVTLKRKKIEFQMFFCVDIFYHWHSHLEVNNSKMYDIRKIVRALGTIMKRSMEELGLWDCTEPNAAVIS